MKKAYGMTSVLIILGSIAAAFGQQHTENNADQVLRGSGRVNTSTLGMEIDIPLGAYPGRGISVPVSLSYSSKVWRMNYTTNQPAVNNSENCIGFYNPVYAENSASGWTTSLAAPYVEYTGFSNTYNIDGNPSGSDAPLCQPEPPPTTPPTIYIKRISIHLPGGETHELRDETNGFSGNSPQGFDGIYYAADGSNLKYIQDSSTGTYRLLMADGSFYDFAGNLSSLSLATIRKANKYTDRNGNFTSYNDANGTWTDTLGRVLSAPFGLSSPGSPATQIYSMPGMTGNYKFYWKKLKDTTAAESGLTDFNQSLRHWGDKYLVFGQSPHYETRAAGTFLFGSEFDKWVIETDEYFNPVVLTQIELPTGQSFKFTYDVYGRIERIFYPTGGEERFQYTAIPLLSHTDPGDLNEQTNFGVTNRKVFQTAGQGTPYEWNYSAQWVASNGYKVTIANPDETRLERYLHRSSVAGGAFGYDSALGGMAYQEDVFSNTNQLVTRKLTDWTVTQFSNGSAYPKEWHPRVVSEETQLFDSSNNGISSTVRYEYDGNLSLRETPLLLKKTAQYAFVTVGSAVPSTPVRTSEMTHLINDSNYPQWVKDIYIGQNMVGLATSTVVKDGAGTVVSSSEIKYDDGGYSPNIGRGNPTNVRVWDSTKGSWDNPNAYISTRAKFDTYGNQYETIDAKGNSTATTFDATYHAYPVQVTSAVPDPSNTNGSNTAFVTTATFNPTTGLPLTTTDANGLETRIEYDPVTLRPLNTKTYYQNNQVGGMSETVYHDEPNNYWVKSRALIDTGKWVESITYFDGLGRAFRAEEVNSEGNIFVEKEFDAEGRVKRLTNPFRANDTKIWTTNVYDEVSRIKEIILPDGARVKTDYGVSISGILGVTKQITDQAGKKRKGITDALGRMVRVTEDPDGQNLHTDYVFDTSGNLRKTTQGEQNRYFTYDSLGRLRYAKHPEQETNTAFGYTDSITNNANWSVKYEYDDNGNITKTTDAENVYVQGTYDNLNRLKTRDYSDSTPDVSFYYDGRGLDSVPAFSKGKTTRVASSVSETRYTSFDNLGRLLSSRQITNGQTYTFGYQYNLTALIAETYPSGRVVNFEYNVDGHLARVAGQASAANGCTSNCTKTYANSISYNTSGAIESMRLGNGRWETAKYNERQQITEIGLGNSANDASLLKLEYGYGTNQQNNGSLRSQKISFSGLAQPFEQTYIYDDLNRLEIAEEKVNGSTTWKQKFQYDRYGNRRFDSNNTTTLAASNNVTNPTFDTATNRFSDGQNYFYDKNGNLIQDAVGKHFLYDAENHQREVKDANNQTIATYQYDGEGRRVKKVLINSGEETIFVYDAGGQVAAEYVINAESQTEPSSTRYLTNDHLGSPRVITDQSGAVIARKDYMAFGEETYTAQRITSHGYASTSNDNLRQGYTGYEKDDESGLDFAQARYYNSAHGRFTSVDPLIASGTIKNPQTFNRYSYVLNSPYKYTDPLGLLARGPSDSAGGCSAQDSSCYDARAGGGFAEPAASVEESHTNEAAEPPASTNLQQSSQQKTVKRLYIFLGVPTDGDGDGDTFKDKDGKIVDDGPDYYGLVEMGKKAGIEVIIVDQNTYGRGIQFRIAFESAVEDADAIGVIFVGHTTSATIPLGPDAEGPSRAGGLMFAEKDGAEFNAGNSTLQTPKAGLIGLFGCNASDVGGLFTGGSSAVISANGGRDGYSDGNTLSYAAYGAATALIQGKNPDGVFNAAGSAFIKNSGNIKIGNRTIGRAADHVGDGIVKNK